MAKHTTYDPEKTRREAERREWAMRAAPAATVLASVAALLGFAGRDKSAQAAALAAPTPTPVVALETNVAPESPTAGNQAEFLSDGKPHADNSIPRVDAIEPRRHIIASPYTSRAHRDAAASVEPPKTSHER